MTCDRALILARGLGTRMQASDGSAPADASQSAAADAGLKAMMPFGRPFLDHVLHAVAEAGVREVALVLGPEHEQVRAYYASLPASRLRISFALQARPLGTADAVLAGAAWAAGDPFIVLNSDNLYPAGVLARLRACAGPAVAGFERDSLGLPIERTGAFALLERDERGCLSRVVEKPGAEAAAAAGPRALVSMNAWRFDARIFDACRDVPLSVRGEKELPEAVVLAASRGVCVEVMPVRGEVLDLSRRGDIAAIAARLDGADVRL